MVHELSFFYFLVYLCNSNLSICIFFLSLIIQNIPCISFGNLYIFNTLQYKVIIIIIINSQKHIPSVFRIIYSCNHHLLIILVTSYNIAVHSCKTVKLFPFFFPCFVFILIYVYRHLINLNIYIFQNKLFLLTSLQEKKRRKDFSM